MEEILYVKIAQNIPVAKRQVTFHDLATLHCTNKKVVQELNQMVFYTLPAHGPQKTMFTIAKVYEVIHQKYPNLKIENLGERDFVIDYEKPDEKEKRKYLQGLFTNVYIKDIVERYKLKDDSILSPLVDALCSAVGSLTNSNKLANTAGSVIGKAPSHNTIKKYLEYVEDAYLFQSAQRWNVKGRKYFDTLQKYYAMDLGLRNARLNFRQQERSHLMENMIYNELVRRGYSVDVGIVELDRVIDGKRKVSQYEIDFVVNIGHNKIYIQSALNIDTPEKKDQELFSLKNTGDFFRKIVVLDGNSKMWTDEDGVTYIGVIPFLLEDILSVNTGA